MDYIQFLESLDPSNSVAAAIVVDGNKLRILQGEKNNLEALRVSNSVAHQAYSRNSIVCMWLRQDGGLGRRLFVRSQIIVAALALRSDLGLPASKCADLQPVEVLSDRDFQVLSEEVSQNCNSPKMICTPPTLQRRKRKTSAFDATKKIKLQIAFRLQARRKTNGLQRTRSTSNVRHRQQWHGLI